MNTFVAESIRDFALLVTGGALTFLGTWVSARAQTKARREDREDEQRKQAREHIDRAITAVGEATDSILSDLFAKRFASGGVVYKGTAMREIRDASMYFPSAELRRASRRATSIVMMLPEIEPVPDDAWNTQYQALSALRVLLGAYARGDRALPRTKLEWLERNSATIRMANADED